MKELNESLKQSLTSLDQLLPQIDHAMAVANEKIQQVNQFQLLWRATMKDKL